jgi:hypothetical protein
VLRGVVASHTVANGLQSIAPVASLTFCSTYAHASWHAPTMSCVALWLRLSAADVAARSAAERFAARSPRKVPRSIASAPNASSTTMTAERKTR